MKRWVLGICFLLACVLCGFEVYASSSPSIDPCDSGSGDAVKTYSGFGAQISNFSDFSGWSACPDQTVLPMREQAQQASAIYQVRGSETVHVSVYVKNGSFAMPTSYGGKYGAYMLGESERGALSDAIRCHYDAVQDRIFLVDGGKAYLLRAAPIGLYFSETDQEGLHLPNPFYGVNIAYTTRPIPQRFQRVRPMSGFSSRNIGRSRGLICRMHLWSRICSCFRKSHFMGSL